MRILQVSSELDGGGVERLLYNYYVKICSENIHFDFVKIKSESEGILEKPLKKLGSRIFETPPVRNGFFNFQKSWARILQQNKYDVIHCHGGYKALPELYFAKCAGIPIRIAHSHVANHPETTTEKMLRRMVTPIVKRVATNLFACGMEAATWMWGNEELIHNKVYIMHNAIEAEHYSYDKKKREAVRKELGISDNYVIGNVGRLSYQKNQIFLVKIFEKILTRRNDVILVLIGRGEDEENIKREIANRHLNNYIRLLGIRDDVPDLLNAFDLFVLPSIWEGLPVSMVEVQANGLPIIASDSITKEVKILDNTMYLPLCEKQWINEIVECRKQRDNNGFHMIQKAGYCIDLESKKLVEEYFKISLNLK